MYIYIYVSDTEMWSPKIYHVSSVMALSLHPKAQPSKVRTTGEHWLCSSDEATVCHKGRRMSVNLVTSWSPDMLSIPILVVQQIMCVCVCLLSVLPAATSQICCKRVLSAHFEKVNCNVRALTPPAASSESRNSRNPFSPARTGVCIKANSEEPDICAAQR